jgi:hypothetical protein
LKTKLAGAVAVVIIKAGVIMYLVCVQTQNVMAKETPFRMDMAMAVLTQS